MGERLNPVKVIAIKGGAWYQGKGLTPEGKTNYWAFVRKIINGEKEPLSEQTGILDGYKSICTGENCLKDLDRGAFLALNYPNTGPLGGFWHTVLASEVVKNQTGREVRWMQSHGSNSLVAIVHMRLAESINGIIVGEPKKKSQGARDIERALINNEIVGIYPEGQPSKKLRPAKKGAGKLIYRAAEKGIPTVATSVWSDGRRLNMRFELMEAAEILAQVGEGDLSQIDLKTGAYVMGEIARNLS